MSSIKTLATTTLALITLALLVQLSHAQNSPQDFVDAHNKARAIEGVGDIQWSDEVAAFAENYDNQRMNDCALQHSDNRPYGENLAVGGDTSFTGVEAVQMWVDEKPNYDYDSNSCAQDTMCGHYTQVVWRDSTRLGCARVECSTGGTFITCNYDPPGNVIGQKPF